MAKILKKGQRGAARAYVTRSTAIKKLQISLADFRRLCILKGIFPREPRHRKRANKGNSVSTSFYYAKDIAFLAHEPVLRKLREHKAFAKKLSRALGRGEWSSAKSLDDNRPTYRLDHIVKERYPTFNNALRDIDDALCLISLFSNLPSSPRIASAIVESCARLASEWQLYVMYTRSLRKVFLSIKGVYFQADVCGETITWLVPYMFTQAVPTDVDIRVMLTFLELYQTLLGFVFFKLYSDAELVYPPALDACKDNNASGVAAFHLAKASANSGSESQNAAQRLELHDKPVKGRDVRRTIKGISAGPADLLDPSPAETTKEQFDATNIPDSSNRLFTSPSSSIFSVYTFYLAPGSPRHLLEFMIRSFGGRVGWPPSMGSGSPLREDDESITHVIIDRPLPSCAQLHRDNRKFVQPQWVADSINAQRVLLEGPYAQGATLPPHLSPFGNEHIYADSDGVPDDILPENKGTAAQLPNGPVFHSSHKSELPSTEPAENHGLSANKFGAPSANDARHSTTSGVVISHDKEMNKMMMSNKQRKLYERIRHSERKRTMEQERLQQRRPTVQNTKAKDVRRVIRESIFVS